MAQRVLPPDGAAGISDSTRWTCWSGGKEPRLHSPILATSLLSLACLPILALFIPNYGYVAPYLHWYRNRTRAVFCLLCSVVLVLFLCACAIHYFCYTSSCPLYFTCLAKLQDLLASGVVFGRVNGFVGYCLCVINYSLRQCSNPMSSPPTASSSYNMLA